MVAEIDTRIADIKETLNYKKESIVSKIITEDKYKSLIGFAFDRGQSILPRKSSVDATIHVLEGQAEVMIGGQNYDITEGEMIVMPKDELHALFAKTKLKLALYKG